MSTEKTLQWYETVVKERLRELADRTTCDEVERGTLCVACRAEAPNTGCLRAWALKGEWPERFLAGEV